VCQDTVSHQGPEIIAEIDAPETIDNLTFHASEVGALVRSG
jgi:hypothetical protein